MPMECRKSTEEQWGLGRTPVCLLVMLSVQYELLWSWVIEENGGLDVGHRKGQSSV